MKNEIWSLISAESTFDRKTRRRWTRSDDCRWNSRWERWSLIFRKWSLIFPFSSNNCFPSQETIDAQRAEIARLIRENAELKRAQGITKKRETNKVRWLIFDLWHCPSFLCLFHWSLFIVDHCFPLQFVDSGASEDSYDSLSSLERGTALKGITECWLTHLECLRTPLECLLLPHREISSVDAPHVSLLPYSCIVYIPSLSSACVTSNQSLFPVKPRPLCVSLFLP